MKRLIILSFVLLVISQSLVMAQPAGNSAALDTSEIRSGLH